MAGGVQQSGKDKKEIIIEEKNDNESENVDDNISTSRLKIKYNFVICIFYLHFYKFYLCYSDEGKPTFNFDIDQELAGLRKKQAQVNPRIMNKGLGDWEKHTKGIGAKLLLGVIYKYYI